jgi:hypothetical protein
LNSTPSSTGFHVSDASFNYEEAAMYCEEKSMTLASIYTAEELAEARAVIKAKGIDKAITSAFADGTGWKWRDQTEYWKYDEFPLNTGQVTDQTDPKVEGFEGMYSLRGDGGFVWDADGREEKHPALCRIKNSRLGSGSGSGSGAGFGDNAVTANECYLGCKEAAYGSGFGVGLLDYYYGCCRALSCMQTCMMRVSGVSYQSCVDKVYEVSKAEANQCSLVVDRRTYDFCRAYDQSTCEVQPTIASGLKGCEIGAKPDISQMDPFCWVYNEGCKQFEPYGHGSTTKLI